MPFRIDSLFYLPKYSKTIKRRETNNLLADVEKVASANNFFELFYLNGTGYEGTDLPKTSGAYKYSTAMVIGRHKNSLSVILIPENNISKPVITNHIVNSGWNEWRDFTGQIVP